MLGEDRWFAPVPIGCRKRDDQILVARAIEGLVNAGLAIVNREVESCPLLYLVSGEVFMLGADDLTRIS